MQSFQSYNDYLFTALGTVSPDAVQTVTDALFAAYERGSMVFVIGNGGSAANASHFAQDLAKGTLDHPEQRKRLRALSLTDNLPYISALGNDEGYDTVFVQQLRTFGSEGDLLLAITGSGNSPNIVRALEYANESGITTIAVTGFDGGRALAMADISLHVPLHDMCSAESIHSILFHYIILALKERIANGEKVSLSNDGSGD